MLRTSKGREQAAHHQAAWISARSHAISDAKFCGREECSKISIENPKSHANFSRAAACRRSAQLLGTSKGRSSSCAPPSGMDFGAISRDFERKILRPTTIFENFGSKSAENRTKSHAPQHADATHSVWEPLRVAARLRVTWRHGFRRVAARFRTRNFAAAKN